MHTWTVSRIASQCASTKNYTICTPNVVAELIDGVVVRMAYYVCDPVSERRLLETRIRRQST
jgi:hypothetical protein